MSDLVELRPTEKLHVIDLVREAGIDVSDWAKFKGGRKRAAMNPKYCYEWSFEQPGKMVVLNVWYDQMRQRKGTIVLDWDMRRHARKYGQVRGKEVWRRRAANMDDAVRTAFIQGLPVRVVVVDGLRRSWRDRDPQASRVDRRRLDPVPWAVTSYDVETGQGMLTRRASPLRAGARKSYLSEIRASLQRLAGEISAALRADPRASGLSIVAPGRHRLDDDRTGGYYTTLGSLTRGVSIEVWLDHYSGLSTPRAWVGFGSASWRHLSRLLSVTPLARLRKGLIRRTAEDVATGSFSHLKDPLRSGEFDVLVREDYGYRHFLGIYHAHAWPFSPRDRTTLVREASNFIGSVSAALTAPSGEAAEKHGASLPWARPDPRSEKAAIRHVRKHLRIHGYSVTSRERVFCGYDLYATRRSQELHIEVKGCKAARPRFFVSRNELNTAMADADWRLVVVTSVSTRPSPPRLLSYREVQRAFDLEPTQWEGRVKNRRV